MRRFEYWDTKSSKFWQVEVDGFGLTVRFGRIGTEGQTKSKAFDHAEKAATEAEKLIRQKIRKGYVEVAADGPVAERLPETEAQAQLAAERTSTSTEGKATSTGPVSPSPASRATGLSAAANEAEAEVFEWTDRLSKLAFARTGQTAGFRRPKSKNKLWQGIRAFMRIRADGLKETRALEGSDLQALVDTALERSQLLEPPKSPAPVEVEGAMMAVAALRFDHEDTWNPLLDFWVTAFGLETALRALVASAQMKLTFNQSDQERLLTWGGQNTLAKGFVDPWARLREHLARADTENQLTLQEVADELRRHDDQETRVGIAFLFPDRPDWAEQEWVDGAAGDSVYAALLACSMNNAGLVCASEEFLTQAPLVGARLDDPRTVAVSILQSNGPDVVSKLVSELRAFKYGDTRAGLAECLACVRRPESIEALIEYVEEPKVASFLQRVSRWHPTVSLGPLAAATAAGGRRSEVAGRLLAGLLRREGDRLAPQIEALSDTEQKAVRELLGSMETSGEAPLESLPEILTRPPWAEKRKKAEFPTLKELPFPKFEELVDWRPGERAQWLAGMSPERPKAHPRPAEYFDNYLRSNFLFPMGIDELTELARDQPDEAREVIRRAASKKMKSQKGRSDQQWGVPLEYVLTFPPTVATMVLQAYPVGVFRESTSLVYQKLAAEHGFDALDHLVDAAARHPLEALPALAPFHSLRPATAVVAALGKRKGRAEALAWIERRPLAAALGLLHVGVVNNRKTRDLAVEGLHVALRRADREAVAAVIDGADEQWGDSARSLLAFDPRELYPSRLPAKPPFWRPETFSRPRLSQSTVAGGSGVLPAEAVEHLGTMLSFTPTDVVYAGILDVLEACDRDSLAAFAWDLFEAWREAGMPPKEGWAFTALGILGNDDTARKLAPLLRVWPGEGGHQRAVTGLEVLARIGTDLALMHLNGIAQKLKFKGLKAKAREKITEIAERRGLTREQLSDRLVPTLGLDAHGSVDLDFGPRSFRVGFDEQLKPFVWDDGKLRANLPKPRKDDDPEAAEAATERFKALKKDVRALGKIELARLEGAMVLRRRWALADFRRFLVEHPLLQHLVRRLVWGVYDAEDTLVDAFRVAEDGTFADIDDQALDLPGGAIVGLAHALELGDERSVAFAEILSDYEILQPFQQLGRSVHRLTDTERESKTLTRWQGRIVPFGRVLQLEKKNWIRGEAQDAGISWWYERPVGDRGELSIFLYLDPGIFTGMAGESGDQTLREVQVGRAGEAESRSRVAFSELDEVSASEMIRDLENVVSEEVK